VKFIYAGNFTESRLQWNGNTKLNK